MVSGVASLPSKCQVKLVTVVYFELNFTVIDCGRDLHSNNCILMYISVLFICAGLVNAFCSFYTVCASEKAVLNIGE